MPVHAAYSASAWHGTTADDNARSATSSPAEAKPLAEKIVKMHAEKRDLADSLLEGSDISAKMTSEDLLDLIKDA